MLTSNKGKAELGLSPVPLKFILHSVCLNRRQNSALPCVCVPTKQVITLSVLVWVVFFKFLGEERKTTKAESKPILHIFHF